MDPAPVIKYRPMELPDVPCHGDMRSMLAGITKADGTPVFPDAHNIPYADIQNDRIALWQKVVADYVAQPTDFVNAWHYLDQHPAFWQFHPTDLPVEQRFHERYLADTGGVKRCVDIMPVKVNPLTHRIDDDDNLNTQNEVWIEFGKYPLPSGGDDDDVSFHDYELDCGGPTMETAIIRAAHLVAVVYGHDRMVCDGRYPRPVTILPSDMFDKLMLDLEDDGTINEKVREAAKKLNEVLHRIEDGDAEPWAMMWKQP